MSSQEVGETKREPVFITSELLVTGLASDESSGGRGGGNCVRSGLGKETVEDSRRLRVHDTPPPQQPDLLNLGQTLLWDRGFISTSPPTAQAAQETLLSGGSGALTAFQHFLLP